MILKLKVKDIFNENEQNKGLFHLKMSCDELKCIEDGKVQQKNLIFHWWVLV